ncbi:O-antigen ligase family protein [Butyrivibrio sp. MB2005]|uniref:O-antigen ligase family protein n=1 Tax=Butyrivibrio sp. MB2005 TaxID=1280678 RepID=UPI0004192FF2|nr:O-antigen ligase family protein [Butyrivibrio sp. MB2005]
MNRIVHVDKRLLSIVFAGIWILFPLRDAIGFYIGQTPIRPAEVWLIISCTLLCVCMRLKYEKYELMLITFISINLVLTILGVLISNGIVLSFAIKYIARNIVYLAVLIIFLGTGYQIDDIYIDNLMKYTVIIQAIACVYRIVFNKFLYLGKIINAYEYFDANFIEIARYALPRLKGTCSEPGYLAPLMAMLLYYFISVYFKISVNKRERKKAIIYIVIILVISLFSFSSAVYGMDTLALILVLCQKNPFIRKYVAILIGIVGVVILAFIIYGNESLRVAFVDNVYNKIVSFLSRNKNLDFNYSAVDRAQHLDHAIEMLYKNSPIQYVIGRGTGAYYYSVQSEIGFLQNNVSEANNIYLSTLTDRGLLGLLCIVFVFIIAIKKRIKHDIISETLYIGIMAQGIHWIIVGNFWLYYFWVEILLLIGYKRFVINNLNNTEDYTARN